MVRTPPFPATRPEPRTVLTTFFRTLAAAAWTLSLRPSGPSFRPADPAADALRVYVIRVCFFTAPVTRSIVEVRRTVRREEASDLDDTFLTNLAFCALEEPYRRALVRWALVWALAVAKADFKEVGIASFRFLVTRSTESVTACWSFLLVLMPVVSGFSASLSSFGLDFSVGLGPRTPRQDAEPQRHSWMFLEEKGLDRKCQF